jgi:hypothetical protein
MVEFDSWRSDVVFGEDSFSGKHRIRETVDLQFRTGTRIHQRELYVPKDRVTRFDLIL